MEYKYKFTGTFKLNEEEHSKLNELVFKSETINIVERKKGFIEVYTKEGINYTTEDIIRKGL